ncbi:hypothetical protein ABZ942_22870 [Nocardia sp. NPDC046473]
MRHNHIDATNEVVVAPVSHDEQERRTLHRLALEAIGEEPDAAG